MTENNGKKIDANNKEIYGHAIAPLRKPFFNHLLLTTERSYPSGLCACWFCRSRMGDSWQPLSDSAFQPLPKQPAAASIAAVVVDNSYKKLVRSENTMIYYVTFKVDARFVAEVEAENVDRARYEATLRFQEADFGDAQDIDGEEIIVEDENGAFVWEINE